MQLVKNGPDIPSRLLQEHEDGNVVFFCGAGISSPAGLPDFGVLVTKIYKELSIEPSPTQKSAIKSYRYDTTLSLLEREITGGRDRIRSALAKILTPDSLEGDATATHKALLDLSKTRSGLTKLVSTNFDRIFEAVINELGDQTKTYSAPFLPVPKNTWNGLVYLHGLIPQDNNLDGLNQLVLSSGDFGLAYLIERWASRFISTLFKNYTICFVGYSINDPILRYMTDALAADRLLGETQPEMYAFGSFSKGKEKQQEIQWRSKNVTPILYKEYKKHWYLHATLRKWSQTYRTGTEGKQTIVLESAMAKPTASTREDDFVGRMLWAMSDPSGLPAKRFAEYTPTPSLSWLKEFSANNFGTADLKTFKVSSGAPIDSELEYSLAKRPAPYDKTSPMCLVNSIRGECDLDEPMRQLARWLVRHLDDPELILWVCNQGGILNRHFARLIEERLEELEKLESNEEEELHRIREESPNGIPSQAMKSLWLAALSGLFECHYHNYDLYDWATKFIHFGLNRSATLELRKSLAPRITINRPFWPTKNFENTEEHPRDIIDYEVTLAANHPHSALERLRNNEKRKDTLSQLAGEFDQLLLDVFELKYELGLIDEIRDFSSLHQPSIASHNQNSDITDWTVLVELLRDAWLECLNTDSLKASSLSHSWIQRKFPIYKRLAFFASIHDKSIEPKTALEWLLSDKSRWLWSSETRRESIRLIVYLGTKLSLENLRELESSILKGPPREFYSSDIDAERWNNYSRYETWLRLAKLETSGAALDDESNTFLQSMSDLEHPPKLAQNESDEFFIWSGDDEVFDPDKYDKREKVELPTNRKDLANHLKDDPKERDNWTYLCKHHFPLTAATLLQLGLEGVWSSERWIDALRIWTREANEKIAWKHLAPCIANAPDDFLKQCSDSISRWMKEVTNQISIHKNTLFQLANRIVNLCEKEESDSDEIDASAISHIIENTTESLLHWWYRQSLADDQGEQKGVSVQFSVFSIILYMRIRDKLVSTSQAV